MKWVLIAVGVIGGLIGLMALIGMMLPKGHRASVRISLKRPAREVFAVVEDFASWPSWNQSVKKIDRVADQNGHPVWLVKDDNGEIPSEVVEKTAPGDSSPGKMITRIADPKLPFGGTWTWMFEPTADGCSVTVIEDGEVYNPIFRFMSRFIFGYTGTGEKFLEALGAKFGEDVTTTAEVS